MDTFADRFLAENDEKLAIYRENIPNFDSTITHLTSSIQNIKSTLQDISNANKNKKELCENESCTNCSSASFNQFLGIQTNSIEIKEESAAKASQNEEKPSKNEEEPEEKEVRFVPQVTEQEFTTIPKYQLGRLTRENLNEIVSKMDEFLMKKNQVFAKTNKQLTRIDRELLDAWRELEEKSKRRLPTTLFFVESDIRPLLQERLRPSFPKAIPCLRHIRRIREERCGPLTFYYK